MTTSTPIPTKAGRTGSLLGLRPVLLLDAGVSGTNGGAYLAAAAFLPALLPDLLGPPTMLFASAGAFLLLWAVALAWAATRQRVPGGGVRVLVAGNLLWVAGSVASAAGLLSLTGIGLVWCLLQAVVVAGFAALQTAAMWRHT